MEKVGLSGDSLISWHKGIHVHPLNNPDYARENLVSLAETMVMLYLYFVIFILTMHWLVLLGYISTQTIPWMLIELNAQKLFNHLPEYYLLSRGNVFIALVVTILAAKLTKHSFALVKAELHPKNKKRGRRAK